VAGAGLPSEARVDLAALRPGDLVRARVTATEGVDLVAVPVEHDLRSGVSTVTDDPVPVAAPRVVPLYNPANVLTAIRIVLVPVFLGLVVASGLTGAGPRMAACIVFCVASATDFVDADRPAVVGWSPRSQGRRPIADRR